MKSAQRTMIQTQAQEVQQRRPPAHKYKPQPANASESMFSTPVERIF
jgi:hypothetical protein